MEPKAENRTHTIEKGETLYSIAEENKIELDDLKTKNNIPINSNLIMVGQN